MESEFWGIEVKPGKTVKCEPGHKVLHLSQASLGETKDKGSENALIFLKANDQKLVIGTLCADRCAQIKYDLVFEKDFELSHSSKNSSVYFCGYKAIVEENSYSDSSDSDSEDEDIQHDLQPKVNPEVKEAQTKPKSLQPESAKGGDSLAKPKPKAVEPNKAEKDDDGLSSDDDEDVTDSEDESDDEDEDTSSDDDEATPKEAGVGEKRPAGSPLKTPVPVKKANQKTDGDGGKKGSEHIATPHPTKGKGKAPANDDKPKQQIVCSTCKACNRKFNSGKALDSHCKAKHANEK